MAITQGLGIQGNGLLESFTALLGRGIEAKAPPVPI